MPGIIIHLLAGVSMFAVGEFYFNYRSKDNHPTSDHTLLLGTTIFFSLFPDFPLGIYYVFGVFSYQIFMDYHRLLHAIIIPISIIGLIIINFILHTKKEPIWIMGIICILIHFTMDTYIHEGGIWF